MLGINRVTTNKIASRLQTVDPEVFKLIGQEKRRQQEEINLIASENFVPAYCSDALSSCLSSKYSEGQPGDRYYAGNEFIDEIETIAQKRALAAYKLSPEDWGVNVQALSGSPANFAVYTALLQPQDKILYLDLPHGGHLSHGFKGDSGSLTATSRYFDTMPYFLNPATETIDYDEMEKKAIEFKPKLIIAGASAYPRLYDYKRFREVANKVGAYLMADMAHIAGLVAAQVIPSPFPYCDIVTTTTHKTLRGPRGALIFSKKALSSSINKGVFPACQGGPHNHTIGAIATAMKLATEPEFVHYQKQVLSCTRSLANRLQFHGERIATGGTDNHLLIHDLNNTRINGSKAEIVLDRCGLVCNKNTTMNDTSARNPNGLRLGGAAMCSRGMLDDGFEYVADLIVKALNIGRNMKHRGIKNKEFRLLIKEDPRLEQLREEVVKLAREFPVPVSALWKDD